MNNESMIVSKREAKKITGGEVIAIAAVATVLAIGILTIVVWKMYTSSKGTVQLPGGFKFQWAAFKSAIGSTPR